MGVLSMGWVFVRERGEDGKFDGMVDLLSKKARVITLMVFEMEGFDS
jgi:hypothetical protein